MIGAALNYIRSLLPALFHLFPPKILIGFGNGFTPLLGFLGEGGLGQLWGDLFSA